MAELVYAFNYSPDVGDGWSYCELECRATLDGDGDGWKVADVSIYASRKRRAGRGDEFKFLTLDKSDPLRRSIAEWLERERAGDIKAAWLDELHDDAVAYGDPNDEHRTVPAF